MKRFSTHRYILFGLFLILSAQLGFAQLSGTKTIPGDYATVALAVADLNTVGVGAGGVTFNVAAGYTESITSMITITATGSAGNPILFQKSGGGANPVITRTDAGTNATSTLGGLGDGIIQLAGTDYITFNGIDLAASDQGIEYGYYFHKPSATDGCQYVTIQNCMVTMTKGTSGYVVGIYVGNGASSVSSATGVTVSAASGVNRNVTIAGNTVSNVHAGIICRGSTAMYDTSITVGPSGNAIQNFGGGSATTTYGVYFIYVTHPSVSNNTINNAGGGGTAHGSSLYGVFYSTVTGNVVGNNNTITMANSSASSATQYLYNGNAVTTESFSNNTFSAGTISSTGTVYLIYSSNNTPSKTVTGNQTSGVFSRTGASGTFYCYYDNGSPTGTVTFSGNNFSNISVTGTSVFYGFLSTTAAGHTQNVFNNVVSNITGGSGTTYGLHMTLAARSVYNNTIEGLTGAGTIYGISIGSGNANIYQNTIRNLSSSSTGTTAGLVSGVYVSASGTNTNIYNNFISDLRATAATGTDAIRGINIVSTTASSTIGLYYNTIYLNATGGATFGSSGIYHTYSATATTAALEMRNNIVVNNSVPAGTGLTVAFRRSAATSLSNFVSTTNTNDLYAGSPGAANLIFYDGTNSDQTITAYKARVTPREANSFSENPPFINVGATPYNLHMQTGTATQTESGGAPVSTPVAITTDFDGDTRNVTTPDVGADEFTGTGLDLTAPTITYTPLTNTNSTSNRTLTATIADPSGVPTVGIGLPVLYWRINSGSYAAATATSLGSNQYEFTFGSGTVLNDTVRYYLCAQDNAPALNVGTAPGGGSGFTANPPAAATPPPSPSSYLIVAPPLSGDYTVGVAAFNASTGHKLYPDVRTRRVMKSVEIEIPNAKSDGSSHSIEQREVEEQYVVWMENGRVYNNELSSPNGVYASITAAINDAVLRGVNGAVRFLLTDASYAETYPIVVSPIPGASGTNTITIRPNTGVTTTISGTSASSIFRLDGADYCIFDGSNSGGTDRNMTVTNTSTATSTAAFWLSSLGTGAGATNNTIKNCTIACGADQSTGTNTTIGILASGSTLSLTSDGADNNNNTFSNNVLTTVRYGIYLRGALASSNSNNTITQNIIGPSAFGVTEVGKAGIIVQYQAGATVSQNEIRFVGGTYALTSGGTDRIGIGIGSDSWTPTATTVTNSSVTRNLIHDITEARTFSAVGIVVGGSGTPSSNIIANNLIYNVFANGTAGDQAIGIGISAGDGDKVLFNSILMQGNLDGQGGTTATTQSAAGIRISATTPANLLLKNNVVSVDLTTTTTSISHYAIVAAATSYAWGTGGADNNDYFFNAANTQMKLGGIGTSVPYTNVADLATWKTQFTPAQDAASISSDPLFSGPSLIPFVGSPVLDAGVAGTGVTIDYTGATRVDPPSMGAYENGLVVGPPNCATIGAPADGGANVSILTTLTWGNGGGGPTGYRLSFGTDNPPTNILNNSDRGNTLSYTPASNLEFNTTYYWKVVAYNGSGDATGCAVWSFTTGGDTRTNTSAPDGGGYMYSASNSTSNPRPLYEWLAAGPVSPLAADSVLTGTRDDDIMSGVVQLPAPFTFYGQQLDSVRASTNGFIVFVDSILAQSLSGSYATEALIPTAVAPNYIVAGYWEDLDTVSSYGTASGVSVRWDAANQVFTFQWNHFGKYNSSGAQGDMVFQINLYYSDNSIGVSFASVGDGGFNRPAGSEGCVGVEGSGAATFGSNYFFQDDKPLNVPTSGVTVKFATALAGLPIQLASFTARVNPNGPGVRVDWTTASETNNYGFYVQRRASATSEWTSVSSLIPGQGTTLEPHSYTFIDQSIPSVGTYLYRLRQIDLDGAIHHTDPIMITLGTTDVKELAPREFALKQNYPNPFNPETIIKFSVENTARATVEVFNLLGQRVATLFDGVADAGQYYKVTLNATNFASGMYIYRLQSGTQVALKKMMFIK